MLCYKRWRERIIISFTSTWALITSPSVLFIILFFPLLFLLYFFRGKHINWISTHVSKKVSEHFRMYILQEEEKRTCEDFIFQENTDAFLFVKKKGICLLYSWGHLTHILCCHANSPIFHELFPSFTPPLFFVLFSDKSVLFITIIVLSAARFIFLVTSIL